MGKKRKSKGSEEVEFKKSLFRFSIVFSFVLSLGLVTRYVLSTLPLEQIFLQRIKVGDFYELNLHKPKIKLHRGILPVVGVFFERVEIKEKRCPLKRMITNNALLVINPWKLMAKEFSLSWVDIGYLELSLPEKCEGVPDTQLSGPLVAETPSVQNVKKAFLQEKHVSHLFREVEKIIQAKKIGYLRIDSFEIRYLRASHKELLFKGEMHAKMGDRILTEIKIREIVFENNVLQIHPAELNTVLSETEISIDFKSSIREGHVAAKANIKNVEGFPLHLETKITKLPISSLTQMFFPKYQISYLWADCQVQLDSPWVEIMGKSLDFINCAIDGPYGSIAIKELDSSLSKINRLQAEFNKIHLDQVIKNKRDLALAGIFANFGTVSQSLTFAEGRLSLEGYLENAELLFSNNSLRDIQKIKKIPYSFASVGGKWTIGIAKIDLDEGEFDGNIQVQFDPKDTEAQGLVTIHRLLLRPSIYKLMVKAKPAIIQVYGKFALYGNRVKKWSAFLVTPNLTSDTYSLENLKVKGESLEDQSSQIKISVANGSVKKVSEIVKWLKVTTLQSTWPEGDASVPFREFSVKLLIHPNQELSWQRGYARLGNDWQLSTEGTRSNGKFLSAWLQWDRPENEVLKWNYSGVFLKGTWTPANAWVNDWLKGHEDFNKEYKSVIGQAKISDDSKKAVEKDRSVLGNKDEE